MKQRRQFIRLILALIGSILPGQIILAQADSKSSITPDMVRPEEGCGNHRSRI